MNENIVEIVSSVTGSDPEQIAKIVTFALRELDLISASDTEVTTGALKVCFLSFGPEACFHLGNILKIQDELHDDGPSLMPETLTRIFGCLSRQEKEFIKNKWEEDLNQRQSSGLA